MEKVNNNIFGPTKGIELINLNQDIINRRLSSKNSIEHTRKEEYEIGDAEIMIY